jgi:hypothetical protein
MRAKGEITMKNRARAILIAMCTLLMAAVVYAQLKKGYYAPSELGILRQTAPVELSPDSNFQVSAYPAPAADLAPGDGLQDVQIYCNTCHSPRYITMQPPLPAATWEAEVNKMNKVFGAAIPDDSTQKIILYLQAHYTPETRK